MTNIFKKLIILTTALSFFFFTPGAFAFQENEGDEQTEEAKKEDSCEAQVMKENEEQGREMDEKDFEKAVKKCEKKKKRNDKPKCQPTGSRLSRC